MVTLKNGAALDVLLVNLLPNCQLKSVRHVCDMRDVTVITANDASHTNASLIKNNTKFMYIYINILDKSEFNKTVRIIL